jgi:hypothetical protein
MSPQLGGLQFGRLGHDLMHCLHPISTAKEKNGRSIKSPVRSNPYQPDGAREKIPAPSKMHAG